MAKLLPVLCLSFLLPACAGSEEPEAAQPQISAPAPSAPENPEVPEEEVPPKGAVATISSVKLVQDCPEAKLAAADEPPRAKANRKAKAKADSTMPLRQPCTQSMVQLAFEGGALGQKVDIKEVRLLSAEGKYAFYQVAVLKVRMPSIWTDDGYSPWQGELAGASSKVSYKLSVPNWTEVEKTLGGSSYGPMYILEMDVVVAGQRSTLRSPEFGRSMQQVIKT